MDTQCVDALHLSMYNTRSIDVVYAPDSQIIILDLKILHDDCCHTGARTFCHHIFDCSAHSGRYYSLYYCRYYFVQQCFYGKQCDSSIDSLSLDVIQLLHGF